MKAVAGKSSGSSIAMLGSATLVMALSAGLAPLAQADVDISGNIDIISDYVFRGYTAETESDGPAVQGGFDIEYDTGLYAGYWASSLGYGTDNLTTTVENNLYVGFGGESGELSYDFGLLYLYYMDDSDASGFEPYFSFGFAGIELGAAYMAQDVSWSNQGDIYWTLGTGVELDYGFELDFTAGFHTYSNRGKYIDSSGQSSGFSHLDISLIKSLGDSPASMFATYVLAGKDRDGSSQTDKIVIGFSYSF